MKFAWNFESLILEKSGTLLTKGLSLFVACVGLASGKAAIVALPTSGVRIFFAGVILALVPVMVGMVFGRYILKMNPVLLLGAFIGACVIPQAMTALAEDDESAEINLLNLRRICGYCSCFCDK
jgi:uncharacterized transporter YbjL